MRNITALIMSVSMTMNLGMLGIMAILLRISSIIIIFVTHAVIMVMFMTSANSMNFFVLVMMVAIVVVVVCKSFTSRRTGCCTFMVAQQWFEQTRSLRRVP